MVVVMVTIVTFINGRGLLPGRSRDVPRELWEFLANQCYALAIEPLGVPVIVRSADLAAACGPFAGLPYERRPVVETRSDWLTKRTVVLEKEIGASPRWKSVLDGYKQLHTDDPEGGPYHLWLFGAADLCAPAFTSIPAARRLVYARLNSFVGGSPWRPPVCGQARILVPWNPEGRGKCMRCGGPGVVCEDSDDDTSTLVPRALIEGFFYQHLPAPDPEETRVGLTCGIYRLCLGGN
ncbi:virion protein US2 [Beluga whale alphaherpesvirus 1]|uniref:Virion protein US2 n=1 Tax=Beluga whale alphaherpesvirus 1 TaxID=1434720 RepID=A0A286MM82_9ALPH|nr:virion protein US2 [Beluga whale alphaherpesvirus 1]ASW27108.1 virion protein US2 [Beluga whale alphaherpesvirus 1]